MYSCAPSLAVPPPDGSSRSEEHTSELQSQSNLVCRLLLEKNDELLHSVLHIVPAARVLAGGVLADGHRAVLGQSLSLHGDAGVISIELLARDNGRAGLASH